MLIQLPNELIRAVLRDLPRRDLFNLAICNKLLHSLVVPILYSDLELRIANKIDKEIKEWEDSLDAGLMELLLQDQRKYGQYVRRIRVTLGEGAKISEAVGQKRRNEEDHEEEEDYDEGHENEGEEYDDDDDDDDDNDDDGDDESQEKDEDESEGDDDDDGSYSVDHEDVPYQVTPAVIGPISSLIEVTKERLNSFRWLLKVDVPRDLFKELIQGPANTLSILEIIAHGSNLPPQKIQENSLPCLRKLIVKGIYSPQRIAELHYLLRASPGLEIFGFGIGEDATSEAQAHNFEFSDGEMTGIGLEEKDFEWEKKPTNWTDFIENCIFKNLQNIPLKEIRAYDARLTSKMAEFLNIRNLRRIDFRGIGNSFDFIEALDTKPLQLETCNILYNREGEVCLFRQFIGNLRPGLRHLVFVCIAWDSERDDDDDELEEEYPGLFSLPEEFMERQKSTLETMTFNLLIHDWQIHPATSSCDASFRIPSGFSKLKEISVPLVISKAEPGGEIPDGPIPYAEDIWDLLPVALDDISALEHLHVLTLCPILNEYRLYFIGNIFTPDFEFRGWVDTYQRYLTEYIEKLVDTYGSNYGHNFGLDRLPPLQWVFVVGGEDCSLEVGFRIEWGEGHGDSKRNALIKIYSGRDARKLIRTKDMKHRSRDQFFRL
ncbi:hypothetical protein TWF730_001864 [Orbilia blumenaviensis]|uniref:F-box domain-containing protein n=1 Tax=Orbilia blumenaviensis TaxID=1796055 RepID=A0AAV9UGE6_9PEZI